MLSETCRLGVGDFDGLGGGRHGMAAPRFKLAFEIKERLTVENLDIRQGSPFAQKTVYSPGTTTT